MHADLVGASGFELRFKQGKLRPAFLQREDGMRGLPIFSHHHTLLALRGVELVQRQFDVLLGILPLPQHQREITLVAVALAHDLVHRGQRGTLLRQQQHAGGLAIQPVYQLQELGLRAGTAHLLDDPEADATATMHRHTGRLVHHHQRIVLVNDREFHRRDVRLLDLMLFRHADRRDAQQVAQFQSIGLVDALLVHPHFAAQDAVNVAFGHAFQMFEQEVVDALTLAAFINLQKAHRIFA